MANYKYWTPEEEQVLKEYLGNCPTINEAFQKTAKKIKRSEKAVSQHYYKKKHVLALCEASEPSMFDKFVLLLKEVFIK